jgi:hypothetical protein
MSWIPTGARLWIWVAIMGLVGFSGLTTAESIVSADVRTCGTSTIFGCSNDTSIKANHIDFFGSLAVGGSNSTGGSGDAQIDWFHDHFGLLASGSTNTTAIDRAVHVGGGQASGEFFDQLVVPVQPGLTTLGAPGLIHLQYHLHGTIHIAAPAFETAFVSFDWEYGFGPAALGGVTLTPAVFGIGAARNLMSTDELTRVIDQDVTLEIGYQVGEALNFEESVSLTALAGGIAGPGALVGVAEGNFLHTATLRGATVFDQFGKAVPNAVVQSDSGFDYVHPGAVVPEPNSLLLAAAGFIGSLFSLRRRA